MKDSALNKCASSAPSLADRSAKPLDDEVARIYAALGHSVRIAILRQLIREDACCCKDIVDRIDLAQSTVSQHLKVLVQAGLVDYRTEGQSSRYSVNHARFELIRDHLTAFGIDRLPL